MNVEIQREAQYAFDQFTRGYRSVEYTRGVFNTLYNLCEMVDSSKETIEIVCVYMDAVNKYEYEMKETKSKMLKEMRKEITE